MRKARSSVKKRKKKAMVDLRVQIRRIVVNMNQPWREDVRDEDGSVWRAESVSV